MWDFNRRYAYYLIDSASVLENVNNCSQKPITESQARPLSRLEPAQQREAWQKAVETAPEGKMGNYFLAFSYFLRASIKSRRMASERELIRFSKRKSSIRVKILSSRVIRILGLSVGIRDIYNMLEI